MNVSPVHSDCRAEECKGHNSYHISRHGRNWPERVTHPQHSEVLAHYCGSAEPVNRFVLLLKFMDVEYLLLANQTGSVHSLSTPT